MILTFLHLLRLGIYMPAQTPPFYAAWFYGSVQVIEGRGEHPLGFELGMSPEFRKV